MNIKKITTVIAVGMAMCGAAFAAGTVSNVKARQRYPWNGKVDIDCTLSGTAGTTYALTVNARDKVGGTNLTVRTVSVEGGSATGNPVSVTPGNYRLVWDADTDLPNGFRGEKISISVSVSESAAGKKFMIVDLQSGAITYQMAAPEGGWTADEYKLTKMAFQRVEAGNFWQRMQGECGRNVTITKPFYLSVSPITRGQCYTLTGQNYSHRDADTSYTTWSQGDKSICTFFGSTPAWSGPRTFHIYLRGNDGWPTGGHSVTSDSIVGKLRSVTGRRNFDLPTWGQLGLASKQMSLSEGGLGCLDYYGYYVADGVDPAGPTCDVSYQVSESYYATQRRVIASATNDNSGVGYTSEARLCMFDIE